MTRAISFGAFFAPFHPLGEHPTVALERDLELIERLDALDFDEAWVGEHHSGGWGTIASPELFLAAAAQRTRRIRLGTGVVSAPYHHPLMTANRIVLLDHLSRGRAMLGLGAGVLPSDAHMLGIDPLRQRDMLREAAGAIARLLREDEPVTIESDWFTLRDATTQLRPHRPEGIPLAIASTLSPVGMRTAGELGLMPLSLGAFSPDGLINLPAQWAAAEEAAEAAGRTIDRADWRIVLPVHLAETRADALAAVRAGGRRWLVDYFQDTLGRPLEFPADGPGRELDAMVEGGGAIVGTPDDCLDAIERIRELTGGFGGLLVVALDWCPREQVLHSFELLARHVVPRVNGMLAGLERSQRWVAGQREQFFGQAMHALGNAFSQAQPS